MRRFAYVANAVAARSGKLEKIALIAEYFRELDDGDLHAAARFFTGNPFAARDADLRSKLQRALERALAAELELERLRTNGKPRVVPIAGRAH